MFLSGTWSTMVEVVLELLSLYSHGFVILGVLNQRPEPFWCNFHAALSGTMLNIWELGGQQLDDIVCANNVVTQKTQDSSVNCACRRKTNLQISRYTK